jgi:LAO/AO transport system kinase
VLDSRRAAQAVRWMWTEINEALEARLRADPGVAARIPDLESAVAAGTTTPSAAAAELLDGFLGIPSRA